MFPQKILIVEDHVLTNECLKLGLEKFPEFSAIEQAFNGRQAIELAESFRPDIILMDICLPEIDGISATATIKADRPEVKIIMTTSLMQKETVLGAFAAKADAYCTKENKLEVLREAIQKVSEGQLWLDPLIARFVIEEMIGTPAGSGSSSGYGGPQASRPTPRAMNPEAPVADSWRDRLTEKEIRILTLIAENKNNEEIAADLGLTSIWISGYIGTVLQKMAVDNEVQAVRKAVAEGLIREPASKGEAVFYP